MKRLDVRAEVKKWAEQDGHRIVRRRLVDKGISRSTAEKLTLGRYPAEPGNLMSEKLIEALEERQQDKAS